MHHNIVRHFLSTNLETMLAKSVINCHVAGLDSVVFDIEPGRVTRLFIAQTNHELWDYDTKKAIFPISFHGHHCDLTLIPVAGYFQNIVASPCAKSPYSSGPRPSTYNKFIYKSKLAGKDGGFHKVGNQALHISSLIWYSANGISNYLELKAQDLHTITVQRNTMAAWMVYEGKEDSDYQPYCYSQYDLSLLKPTGLYQPMTKEYLVRALTSVWPNL